MRNIRVGSSRLGYTDGGGWRFVLRCRLRTQAGQDSVTRTVGHDPSILQDQDPIGDRYGAGTMCDQEYGFAFGLELQHGLDQC